MHTVIHYRKPVIIIVLLSLSWFYMIYPSAHAAMVTTEDVFNQKTGTDSDHSRIRAFVGRHDVLKALQLYGISSEEALGRVDSLTDREIAMVVGRLDHLPAGGNASTVMGSQIANAVSSGANALAAQLAYYALLAAAIIFIVAIIVNHVIK